MSANTAATLPRVTMAVLGYNQESSIGYAIDSALNQDYEGEITFVFSDDCSSDNTFAVMQEKAAAYKGRHKIILNRNEVNKKHAGNLYDALMMAPADYYCKQDGDDYSAPDRISSLIQVFLKNHAVSYAVAGVKKLSVGSYENIDQKLKNEVFGGTGAVQKIADDNLNIPALGCVSMWSAQAMNKTAQMGYREWKEIGEDGLLMNIARLFGDVVQLDKEVLCYILHQHNSSWVSREYRYSSYSAFKETEHQLLVLQRRSIPIQENTISKIKLCMRDFSDIDKSRRRGMEKRLKAMENGLAESRLVLSYMERGFLSNLVHWLTHRNVRLSVILPTPVKYFAGRVLQKRERIN